MLRMLLHWIVTALAIWIGFYVVGPASALIAAFAIGLVNATLGLFLKIVTFPLTILTLGIFWFVINAMMLQLAAALVPGFYVAGFLSAFFGAIGLSIVSTILHSLVA